MNLFFDTSVLVKYFHPETGTEQVTALIQDGANPSTGSGQVRFGCPNSPASSFAVPYSGVSALGNLTSNNWQRLLP